MRERLRRRVRGDEDRGVSIIELLVAMGIFTMIISVFMAGLVVMTKATARAQGVSDATSSVRKVMDRFDHQVRYSSAINRPGSGASGAFYIEFIVPAETAGDVAQCVQWRYAPSARTIAVRNWDSVGSPVPSPWIVLADDVRNDIVTQPPFVFLPTSTKAIHQSLTVHLDAGPANRAGADVSTTFVARNTSSGTVTNLDSDHDGNSDYAVCQGVGRP